MSFSLNVTLLSALKGNNSCKMYNIRIEVGKKPKSLFSLTLIFDPEGQRPRGPFL